MKKNSCQHFHKVIPITIFLLSCSLHAANFTYTTVTICGPVGIKSWKDDKFPDMNAYKYYYIHKSNDGKIVVWNNFYQYSNFSENTYHHLYVHNGGSTSLNYSIAEGVEKYILRLKNQSNSGKTRDITLLVNLSSGTFISRTASSEPDIGVCNPINLE